MRLHTSIDQTFSQIAVSASVGVIAFSDNGNITINQYNVDGVATQLHQFAASASAVALSPNYKFCAYTVANQTYVRNLETNEEAVHECKGQIRVNDNGDLLATDPIYFNEPLGVTLHGNVMCTFTHRGYAFATEREIYDGNSISITAETIVGLWHKFFATDQGTLFNYSGVNIQRTGLNITDVFDYGNFAGVFDGESLYVTDGYYFREHIDTAPFVVQKELLAQYPLPVAVKRGVAGAFRIGRIGAGRPTCVDKGIYLHVRQTDSLEFYVGAENLRDEGEFDVTKYQNFVAPYLSVYFVGAESEIHVNISSVTPFHDGVRVVTDANIPALVENPELLQGVVFSTAPVDTGAGDVYTMRQFRFQNNSIVDEVTGGELILAGTAKVENNKLVTNPPAYTNYAGHPNVLFDANEDFYIRVSVNMPFSNARAANTILGVYETGATNAAWALFRMGNDPSAPSGVLRFAYKGTDSVLVGFNSTSVLAANTDYVIEISRNNGTLYMMINGVLESTLGNVTLGNIPTNQPIMRTDVVYALNQNATTHLGGGFKWDIQIRKGISGPISNHVVAPIVDFDRPVLSAADFDAIVLQLGFRRGSPMCEKYDTPIQLFGTAAISKQARLTQTNVTTSYASIPIKYFGAADFTIEFTANISAFSQYGAGFGHYHAVGTASEDNRWLIAVTTNYRVGFFIARSAAADDYVAIYTPINAFLLNRDNQIRVQRKAGIVYVYVNDVLEASLASSLPIRGTAGVLRTQHFNAATSFAGQLWNVRIADKAMYTQPEGLAWFTGKTLSLDGYRIARGVDYLDKTFTTAGVVTSGADMDFAISRTSYIDVPSTNLQPAASNWEIFFDITPKQRSYMSLFNLGGGLNIAWPTLALNLVADGNIRIAGSPDNASYNFGSLDAASGNCGTYEANRRLTIRARRVGSLVEVYVNEVLTKTFAISGSLYNSSARPLRIGRVVENPGGTSAGRTEAVIHRFYFNIL